MHFSLKCDLHKRKLHGMLRGMCHMEYSREVREGCLIYRAEFLCRPSVWKTYQPSQSGEHTTKRRQLDEDKWNSERVVQMVHTTGSHGYEDTMEVNELLPQWPKG
ncbi:hypothetical protein STEG23_011624 [Scotinomys teguina]